MKKEQHHHPYLQTINLNPNPEVFYLVDTNINPTIQKTSVVVLNENNIESNGSLASSTGATVLVNSFIATITSETKLNFEIIFNCDSKSVLCSFGITGNSTYATFTSSNYESIQIELPKQVIHTNARGFFADLDFTIHLIVLRLLGFNIQCGSNDAAIQECWQKFLKIYKNRKNN